MKTNRARSNGNAPLRTTPSAAPSSPLQPVEDGPYRAEPRRVNPRRGENSILETAAERGTFRTLAGAIRSAGLVDLMSGKGPFTLFAPTDEAFARMPQLERETLLKDKASLAEVLTYHLVRERVKAPTVGSPRTATTVNGATLTITVKNRGFRRRGFKVNDAKIVKTEILASNGVIHAIDSVLTPR
ncbi:MAG TPA: fasciclin domain-containing protein [Gemmatimonadaceae bacterium]|nr:fasciclin domain-containing protein [Gemmatimonadaceae bacterium]